MSLSVRVRTEGSTHAVTVRDPQHGRLEATFSYRDDTDEWLLAGVDVHIVAESGVGPGLQPSAFRDLPMVRWQRAARAALVEEMRQQFREFWSDEARAIRAIGIGRMKYRDVQQPRMRRQLGRMRRLAQVARLYQENVAAGRTDPAAAVASELQMNRSTTRSLISRARKAGLLAPVEPHQ